MIVEVPLAQRVSRRQTLALSATDVLFAVLTLCMLWQHLGNALARDFVSQLFSLQQVAVLLFVLTHRPAHNAPVPVRDVLWAWAGTLLLLALRPAPQGWLVPGGLLLLLGVILSLAGVLSLGRSFGIEPAVRGVQTHGMYRFVRHPMYAAYLLVGVGYTAAHWSLWNVVVLLAWMTAQVVRIRREEAVLRSDPAYVCYQAKVRWRLVPFIW